MNWISIRKGVISCHFEYDYLWTDLFVTDTQYRVTPSQGLELSLDLNKNLHTRDKSENTYLDCLRLRSNVAALKTIQVHDQTLRDAITKHSRQAQGVQVFRVRVVLDRDYWFEATAAMNADPLGIHLGPTH